MTNLFILAVALWMGVATNQLYRATFSSNPRRTLQEAEITTWTQKPGLGNYLDQNTCEQQYWPDGIAMTGTFWTATTQHGLTGANTTSCQFFVLTQNPDYDGPMITIGM
jgi:hypothetical protein